MKTELVITALTVVLLAISTDINAQGRHRGHYKHNKDNRHHNRGHYVTRERTYVRPGYQRSERVYVPAPRRAVVVPVPLPPRPGDLPLPPHPSSLPLPPHPAGLPLPPLPPHPGIRR